MSTLRNETRTSRIPLWVFVVAVAAAIGAILWFQNPANKDDASDAYYACVDVMNRDVIDGTFGDPGDQTYAGSQGNWTITGTFVGTLGDRVPFTCEATRMTDGTYRIAWR